MKLEKKKKKSPRTKAIGLASGTLFTPDALITKCFVLWSVYLTPYLFILIL